MAESQAAEEARRRNPVKLGIWIAGFLVAVVGLWIGKEQLDIYFASSNLNNLNAQWKAKEPLYIAVTKYQGRIGEIDHKLAALDRLTTNRFLWGSVLNALQQTVVDQVQVTRVAGAQTYVVEEPTTIGTGPNKAVVPGSVIEKVKLTIAAKDYNPKNEGYSKYKETLCNFDFFVKHLGRRDGFVLDGALGPLRVDPQDPARQFQDFSLGTHFPDARRNE
jgi:hypothetical protein